MAKRQMEPPENPEKSGLWHPFSPLVGGDGILPVKSGRGARLVLEDGRELIDGISSWWVNLHGHGEKKIARAIYRQARRLEQVIFAGFSHGPARALAAKLLPLLPGPMTRLFFSDDGSTAVEVALKMAIQKRFNENKKPGVLLALDGAYHGDTFGAMAAGARGLFTKPFDPGLFPVTRLPFPASHHSPTQLAKVLGATQKVLGKGNVAAFIYEPAVQGAGGMRFAHHQTMGAMLRLCQNKGVTLIADEVMTGFGRTGPLFASAHLGVAPDLICLSKGITGGFLPMGVTAVGAPVVKAFEKKGNAFTFWHGHSYTANPLACAAAVASLEMLTSVRSLNQQKVLEQNLAAMAGRLASVPGLKNTRHLGKILAFEVCDPAGDHYLSPLRDRLYRGLLDRGVLLRPLGNTLYLLPPYVITVKELAAVERAILSVVQNISAPPTSLAKDPKKPVHKNHWKATTLPSPAFS